MIEIEVNYEGDLHCNATHLPSGASIQTDAPIDNHGRGECFSPTDLTAASFGSCMLTLMGIAAQRHNIDLKGMRAKVRKFMSTEPPRRIGRLEVDYHIPLPPDHPKRQLLENAALTCPIHYSLHPDIEQKIEFYWEG